MLFLCQENGLAKTPYHHTYLISADEISALILPQAITAVHYPGVQALSNKLASHPGDDPLALAYTQDQKGLLIYPRGKEGKWQLLLALADHRLLSLHVVAGHGLEGQVFKIDADASQKQVVPEKAVKVWATCKK